VVEIFSASILLGIIAGLLAGLFGIGGGVVIVPALVLMLSAQGFPAVQVMLTAVATSLATIILTAISSVLAHHRLGSVVWARAFGLSPGIMTGAAAGAVIAEQISAENLRLVLAVFLIFVALQMALQIQPKYGSVKQSKGLDYFAGGLIGLLSSIVGIGGGTLTVPYLAHGRMPMRNAIAVAGACGFPVAIAGTLSYALLGWNNTSLPDCGVWAIFIYLHSSG
jgi:uncharacterized membrane protein YfcA